MTMKLLHPISIAALALATTTMPACGDDAGGDSETDGSSSSSTSADPTEAGTDADPSSTAADPATTSPAGSSSTSNADTSDTGSSSTSEDGDTSTGATADDASVRIFHVAIQSDGDPNAGFGAGAAFELDVDVYVDGALALESLALAEASERLSLTSGDHDISVRAAGEDDDLLSATATVVPGDSTLIVYSTSADFVADLELALFSVDESTISAQPDEAAFLAVHVDGNAQGQTFVAYSAAFTDDGAEALGDAYGYETVSGAYGVTDVAASYLDSDAGDYDGGFNCATPGVALGEPYLLVWGTNTVAAPGTLDFSTNAFVLASDTAGPQQAIGCIPQ